MEQIPQDDPKKYNVEQPKLDDLISLHEASMLSGLSHDHLRRLAGQGKLWAKKIGRNWVTTEQAVREYLSLDRRSGPKKKG
jgi:hypothetical protein